MFGSSHDSRRLLWFLAGSICWAVVGASGCSSSPTGQREVIDAVVIRNDTGESIYDVVLRVPSTEMMVSTNRILPFREYSLGFTPTKNERREATLSWTHRDRGYTRDVSTLIPTDLDREVPSRVVISVGELGELKSRIEPYPAKPR